MRPWLRASNTHATPNFQKKTHTLYLLSAVKVLRDESCKMRLLALALTAALLPVCLASVSANSMTQGAASAADRNETSFDGKCTIIGQNVAITTPDIHFFPSKFSVDTCCDLCAAYPGCGAFTLNASGCALKRAGEHPPVRVAAGVTSGVNPNVKPATYCTGSSSGLNAVSCAAWQVFAKATSITGWTECSGALLDPCSCIYTDKSGYRYGVTCAYGNITVIEFESNNLKGTIPSSLGSLTELTSIGLGMNVIRGSIPSSIGQLTGLTKLGLAYNLMTGPVPPLPFAQYTGGCFLEDNPDACNNYGQCNNFSCPLPPHADQCTAGADPGVRC
jgi:hypothetical protein